MTENTNQPALNWEMPTEKEFEESQRGVPLAKGDYVLRLVGLTLRKEPTFVVKGQRMSSGRIAASGKGEFDYGNASMKYKAIFLPAAREDGRPMKDNGGKTVEPLSTQYWIFREMWSFRDRPGGQLSHLRGFMESALGGDPDSSKRVNYSKLGVVVLDSEDFIASREDTMKYLEELVAVQKEGGDISMAKTSMRLKGFKDVVNLFPLIGGYSCASIITDSTHKIKEFRAVPPSFDRPSEMTESESQTKFEENFSKFMTVVNTRRTDFFKEVGRDSDARLITGGMRKNDPLTSSTVSDEIVEDMSVSF